MTELVKLREVVFTGARAAKSLIRQQLEDLARGQKLAVDLKILTILDRLAQVGVFALEHRLEDLWHDLIDSLASIYRAGIPSIQEEGRPPEYKAILLVSVIHRVFMLGGLAVRLKRFRFVPELIAQRVSERYEHYYWIRYSVTMAARGEVKEALKGKSLIGPASEYVRTRSQFFGLFDENLDEVVNAMCQFDFLQCLMVLQRSRDETDCYPNFGAYWNYRTIPIVRDLVRNGPAREALPGLSDEELASALVRIDRLAGKAFFDVAGWTPGSWEFPEIEEYIRKHATQ